MISYFVVLHFVEGFQASSKNTLKKQSSVSISNLLEGKTALLNKKACQPCRIGQIPKVGVNKDFLKKRTRYCATLQMKKLNLILTLFCLYKNILVKIAAANLVTIH